MMIPWFQDPTNAAMTLQDALHRAVPERELTRQALRKLLTEGALPKEVREQLDAAGLGAGDLAEALARLAKPLLGQYNPMALVVRAYAHVVAGMDTLARLEASPALDLAVGIGLVREVTCALFPLTGERPDPLAGLRRAAGELLAFREVSPEAYAALGADERAHLAQRLLEEIPLMVAVAPAGAGPGLAEVVEAAAQVLVGPSPTLAALNAGLAPQPA